MLSMLVWSILIGFVHLINSIIPLLTEIMLEDFSEYLPNMILKSWTVSIQYLGNAMLSKLIGFLYEIDLWDCFTNCWTASSKAAPRMPTQKLHRLYAMTLTSSPTPLPVRVVDVDVPGETKVRDFADHAVGEKNVAGREVSVYELKRSGSEIASSVTRFRN